MAYKPVYLDDIMPMQHQHVIAFKTARVIAVRYPELPAEATLFGSNAIYFSYRQAIEEAKDVFIYNVMGMPGQNISPEFDIVSNIPKEDIIIDTMAGMMVAAGFSDDYWRFDRFNLIGRAWIEALARERFKPNITNLCPEWDEFTKNNRLEDVSEWTQYRMDPAGPTWATAKSYWAKESNDNPIRVWDRKHPLRYFPISRLLPYYFQKVVIYDPTDYQKNLLLHNQLKQYYGLVLANSIFKYITGRGVRVTLADIVKPLGIWGFEVDLSAYGLATRYSLPLDTWFVRDKNFIKRHSYQIEQYKSFVDDTGSLGYPGAQWSVRFVKESTFNNIEYLASKEFDVRDNIIQYWIKSAHFHTDPNQIAYFFNDRDGNACISRIHIDDDAVERLYPIKIERKTATVEDVVTDPMFVGMIMTSISIIMTAGSSSGLALYQFIGSVGQLMLPLIKRLFSFLPDGLEGVSFSILSSCLQNLGRKGLDGDSAYVKIAQQINNMAQNSAKAMGETLFSDKSNDVYETLKQIDNTVPEEDRNILEAILYYFEPDAEHKIDELLNSEFTAEVGSGFIQIMDYRTNNLSSIRVDKINEPVKMVSAVTAIPSEESRRFSEEETKTKISPIVLGAGAVGLALLLKKFLK